MRIGIVGGGTVGRATARAWLEHCEEVRVYDVRPERATHLLRAVLECDLIFLALPTPGKPDGTLDTSEIDAGFFVPLRGVWERDYRHLGRMGDRNFVLRSTVPIGTTRRLREQYGLTNLCHSPDFVTSRCAVTDAQMPAQLIIGGIGGSRCCECEGVLRDLYEKRFPGVPILWTRSDESEAIKLMLNAAFAVKVSLFNEFHSLSEALGLDWDFVRAGILGDGRIAHSHTQCPGPDGKFGFGGDCLPKDAAQLLNHLHRLWAGPFVVQTALDRNAWTDRKREV